MLLKQLNKMLTLGLLCLFFTTPIFAQRIGFSINGGYNKSSLNDLKAITKDYIDNARKIGIEVTTFDNFPAYFYLDPQLSWYFGENYLIGIHYLYTSTGSRVHYIDYSGELKLDQIAELSSPGLILGYPGVRKNHFELWLTTQLNYLKIKYNISHKLKLWDLQETYQRTYTSGGVSFEPGFRMIYLYKKVEIGLSLIFRFAYEKKLTAHIDDQDEYLYLNGKQLKANWNGFRIGLSIGFRLNFERKNLNTRLESCY